MDYTKIRTPSFFSKSIVSKHGGKKGSNGFYYLIGFIVLMLFVLYLMK